MFLSALGWVTAACVSMFYSYHNSKLAEEIYNTSANSYKAGYNVGYLDGGYAADILKDQEPPIKPDWPEVGTGSVEENVNVNLE